MDLDDSFGIAFQAGADLDITQAWFLNLDLKYIDINTTATLKSGGTKRKVDVEIDPWVIGIGIGFKF